MIKTLALDPGKNRVYGAYGCAATGKLLGLRDFNPKTCADVLVGCDLVVIEKPVIHAGTRNWQSVLDEAWAGAIVAGRHHAPIEEYTPPQWKGSIKKPLHHWHLWKILDSAERAMLGGETTLNTIKLACQHLAMTGEVKNYSFEQHNRLDAAALLMFEFKRLGRGGKKV